MELGTISRFSNYICHLFLLFVFSLRGNYVLILKELLSKPYASRLGSVCKVASTFHYVGSVQIRSFFWSVFGHFSQSVD